ncbi:MAG TPA: malectin domain-containing carbohydrate-binding protein [Bryobacteraceae bacterium]|nr:malectin domain-containing carbohydrate-binding protein [Bryobacteraceae bacterium]
MNGASRPRPCSRERAELEAILASPLFQRAPHLSKLLAYLCERTCAGEADSLKEYSIATEAMGLPPDFSEKKGAVVRVEMHRLRKRLQQYYETEGSGRSLRIELLPGQYAPRFVSVRETAGLDSSAPKDLELPPPRRRRSFRLGKNAVWGAVALVIPAAFYLAGGLGEREKEPQAPQSPAKSVPAPAAGFSGGAIRILAGFQQARYVDRMGNTWQSDSFVTGGYPSHYEGETRPVYVARAPDPGLFQSYRSGDFTYEIPLAPGSYQLALYFMEHKFGEGTTLGGGEESRSFDVYLNDELLLWRFDILADIGEPGMAAMRVFRDVTPAADGKLHLRFQSVHDRALLNAIEILPTPDRKTIPVRIVAQDRPATDAHGEVWELDRFYRGGRLAPARADSGAPNSMLLGGERFGNFSYVIPVDPRGRYKLSLYFMESFFGAGNPGESDRRRRTFDVYSNGRVLLDNFEILAEASPRQSLVKTFHNLVPTPSGKLIIGFQPRGHHALVNAIEVVEER